MNRLTDNDKRLGPLTLGRWGKTFAAYIKGGDDEDRETCLIVVAFGWAVRLHLPFKIKPWGKFGEHSRQYGMSLSDMGNGYDFLQLHFGAQTHDTSTEKSWCCHLPWKRWDLVRRSIYTPAGDHFHTQPASADILDFLAKRDECPKVQFEFDDYDGARIVATCYIEEHEWRRGVGWCQWLRWFYAPKIRRSLDLAFSAEVGPEKGSWKGGTIGHGIDMLPGEDPEAAFRRYCAQTHKRKGREFDLRFVGRVGERLTWPGMRPPFEPALPSKQEVL